MHNENICVPFMPEPKILYEVGTEVKENKEEGGHNCDHLTFFPVLNETSAVAEAQPDPCTTEPYPHSQYCRNIRIILQELHPGEEVL